MDAFPAFIPLRGAHVIIVGEGEAADAKARLFKRSPAEVKREAAVSALMPGTYAGARLVFISLPPAQAEGAAAAARAAGALVNVVDQPALCDFHTPSIIDRGMVVGAIGTGGAAPLLASRLRTEWEARWPEGLGRLAELLATVRIDVRKRLSDMRERRAALLAVMDGAAGEAALVGDMARALALASATVGRLESATGRIVRLTAPEDPEDLTIGDLRVLARADRLVSGAGVGAAVLAHARRDAVRHPAADEATLAAWAGAGETVVVIEPPRTFSLDPDP